MPDAKAAGVELADAGWADIDQIAILETASFPTPWRSEFFESELEAEGRFNRVARAGGRVIGYCFSMYFMEEMHVNKIAVAAAWRRRGIAKLLMDDAMAFGRSRGVSSVALEVRESNAPARAFYAALGFEERYRRPRYYPDGETAVVMMLDTESSGE
ncbi:MAG TPA: ribosomal protein S18-alanine N-acetyltransferase [Thermoanaerobaculia bacterium]|nr:ribosomal protein S18-alanine N-acetyltransferase [Thermoanaerobaculia bacterium]